MKYLLNVCLCICLLFLLIACNENSISNSKNINNDVKFEWVNSSNGLKEKYIHSLTLNKSILYAGTDQSGIWISSDKGLTWLQKNNGLDDKRIYQLINDGSKVYALTGSNGIYYSADSAKSWTNIGLKNNLINSIAVNNGTLYACSFETIYVSTNLGASWTEITDPKNKLTKQNINSIAFLDNEIYISSKSINTNKFAIYKLDNSAKSWVKMATNSENLNIYELVVFDNSLYATSETQGVLQSTDYANTWQAKNTGINNQKITNIAFNNEFFFASNNGLGVFYSSDKANSWTLSNSGLSDKSISAMQIYDDYLFVGTLNNGIYRMRLKY